MEIYIINLIRMKVKNDFRKYYLLGAFNKAVAAAALYQLKLDFS